MSGDNLYAWVDQECPICEMAPARFLGRRGGAAHRQGLGVECKVWKCHRCGLIFPNPMPVPADGLNQHYAVEPDEFFRQHDSRDKLASARYLLAQAEKNLGGSGRLLDIGSGRGELLCQAVRAGWEAVGIEPSPTFANRAISELGVEVRREPVDHCGFPSASFDAVILAAVLEHLYNPDEVIKEVARILRPGGILFVDVPNEEGLYFMAGNFYQRVKGRDWVVNLAPTFPPPFTFFGYGPKSLCALLNGCVPPD